MYVYCSSDSVFRPFVPAVKSTNSSATPHTSTLWTDSRRQQQGQEEEEEKKKEGKGRGSSVGEALEGERGGSGEDQDQNRHKPKESSIFSPALNQTQEVSYQSYRCCGARLFVVS